MINIFEDNLLTAGLVLNHSLIPSTFLYGTGVSRASDFNLWKKSWSARRHFMLILTMVALPSLWDITC